MSNKFKFHSTFSPAGDQPQAIAKLVEGLGKKFHEQTLLGVTGSGKTFTMAKVVEKIQKPTLVISHNKTLAAQLYGEFRRFFPENAVHYFVSYYDYYQPEAYIPHTDTYIEKEATINEEIDRLRHAATQSLLNRNDVLIVASVSCIYGLGEKADYAAMSQNFKVGEAIKRNELLRRLIKIQYERNDIAFARGQFRVKGENIDIHLATGEAVVRITMNGNVIDKIIIYSLLSPLINGESTPLRPPLEGGLDETRPPLEGGLDETRPPLEGGLDETRPPLEGGLDETRPPLEGGLDETRPPLEGGLDETRPPLEGGLDENAPPFRRGVG